MDANFYFLQPVSWPQCSYISTFSMKKRYTLTHTCTVCTSTTNHFFDGLHLTEQGYEKFAHVIAQSSSTQLYEEAEICRCSYFRRTSCMGPRFPARENPKPSPGEVSCLLWAASAHPQKNQNPACLASHPGGAGKWKGSPCQCWKREKLRPCYHSRQN
jgi:hypothetical protein